MFMISIPMTHKLKRKERKKKEGKKRKRNHKLHCMGKKNQEPCYDTARVIRFFRKC